jgi:hypothetical protein
MARFLSPQLRTSLAALLLALPIPQAMSQNAPGQPQGAAPFSPPPAPLPSPGTHADATARILAGMPQREGSPLPHLAYNPVVQAHAAAMADLWRTWEAIRLGRMRVWSLEVVQPQIRQPDSISYLFGGPDFVSVALLFPGASHYTLGGLEPVGQIPDLATMSPEDLAGSLGQIRFNLRSIQERGFFVTQEMRQDLGRGQVSGVWPILALFVVRTGHEILSMERISLDAQGQVVAAPGKPDGVRIRFRAFPQEPGFPAVQTLDYFTADASNAGFRDGAPYVRYLTSLPAGGAYLKAASYLMHGDSFSNVRSHLLRHSNFILQDSSGIPIRLIDPATWEIQLYGRYIGPVADFAKHDQPQLRQMFQSQFWRGQLPFGANYRNTDDDAHQILAFKRAAALPLRPQPTYQPPPPGQLQPQPPFQSPPPFEPQFQPQPQPPFQPQPQPPIPTAPPARPPGF